MHQRLDLIRGGFLALALLSGGMLVSAAGAQAEHACRFWSLIGHDYPADLISTQLRDGETTLQELGQANDNGWGFAHYPADAASLNLTLPLTRRGGPPAISDPDFDLAVTELAALDPRAALANVRQYAIRHPGIPNPHPFHRDGITFAHSGNIFDYEAVIDSFLPHPYFIEHPLDYTVPELDSEIYCAYLSKAIAARADSLVRALVDAIIALAPLTGDDRLDFVMIKGDTLLALRYAGHDETEPVTYTPTAATSAYWAVATDALGERAADWAEIPPRTLAVFIPGDAPAFHALPAPAGDADSSALVPPKTRFWGLTGSGYPDDLITAHLRDGLHESLKGLGSEDSHGWGLAAFADTIAAEALRFPILRRGGPPANNAYATGFTQAVDEMSAVRPRAAVGHVRKASSAHPDVPDPHPFTHAGQVFVHNGTLSTGFLVDYLEGDDFLERHPPDYSAGHIDSEFYFLYLLKYVEQHPDLARPVALRDALRSIAAQSTGRLNFILTDGDTLYALRYNDSGGVRFYPADAQPSPHWSVASQWMGNSGTWGTIPEQTLCVFVPDEAPDFLPIHGAAVPEFSLSAINVVRRLDQDGDYWGRSFEVSCDADAEWGGHSVALGVSSRVPGGDWVSRGKSRYQGISGILPDTITTRLTVKTDSLAPQYWDLRLELFLEGVPDSLPATVATPETHPYNGLSAVKVEGAWYDTIPNLPPAFGFATLEIVDWIDEDDDGYARAFQIAWDLDLAQAGDTAQAYVEVSAFQRPSSLIPLGTTEAFSVRGTARDTVFFPIEIARARQPASWDLTLRIFDAIADTLAFTVDKGDYGRLGALLVEGARHDEPDLPTAAEIGLVSPMPSRPPVSIPIAVAQGGAETALRIWNSSGRLIWSWENRAQEPGEWDLIWEGDDLSGQPVPAGIYFAHARVGSVERWQRIVLVR